MPGAVSAGACNERLMDLSSNLGEMFLATFITKIPIQLNLEEIFGEELE